jgi:hypothetical protein
MMTHLLGFVMAVYDRFVAVPAVRSALASLSGVGPDRRFWGRGPGAPFRAMAA